jgi:prepilin peptidase dependent protein B
MPLSRLTRRRQRGLGLVELLVGLAVGLFVVAGGLLLFAGFVDADRRMVVESRLLQDLRAAADVITRDIRRGGYWDAAPTTVWSAGGPSVTPRNAYAWVMTDSCASGAAAASSPTGTSSGTCYWINASPAGVSDGNNIRNNEERYGFYLLNGVLYADIGGVGADPTPLTDPKAVNVTDLRFDWTGSRAIAASGVCTKGCTDCPTVVVREVEVRIRGTVPGDATIARELRSNVRVRNDLLTGQCTP